MKIAKVVAIVAVSLSSGLAVAQNRTRESQAEKQITGALHQMYEAEKRKDLKFVLSHLADDFAEVAGDGGIYHRSDIEAGWNDVVLKDYTLSDCAFRLMTRDAAYLACRLEVDATYKGQPFPQRFRLTTVWTRHGSQWLIRLEQGTIIPEPAKDEQHQGGLGNRG
jgi:ketosteroid isomerase-like protein